LLQVALVVTPLRGMDGNGRISMSDSQAKPPEDYLVAAPHADDVLAARAKREAAAFADLYERHYEDHED
jgi:hypothetical protein